MLNPNLTRQVFEARAKVIIDNCKENMAEFSKEFAKDPCNALEWSVNVFRDAARIRVWHTVLSMNDIMCMQDILTRALSEVVDRSADLSSSTSVPDNLVKRYILKAWADVVDFMYDRH